MLKLTGIAGAMCLLLVGLASGSAQSPAAEATEAPVVIPEGAGQWIVEGDGARRNRFSARPSLSYQVPAFPRLRLNLIRFECQLLGAKVTITGLAPAQRFPQPAIAVTAGSQRWSGVPDAVYHDRSNSSQGPSITNSMLDDNLKGANLSWPGHPAYASLSFFSPAQAGLPAALGSESEIQVAFEGQQRRFPAVPAEVSSRFNQACARLAPTGYSAR